MKQKLTNQRTCQWCKKQKNNKELVGGWWQIWCWQHYKECISDDVYDLYSIENLVKCTICSNLIPTQIQYQCDSLGIVEVSILTVVIGVGSVIVDIKVDINLDHFIVN